MKLPTPFEIQQFQERVWTWWKDNLREFPWRETRDPYFILVSEFMLQQTQASRVIPKYLAFISRYPSANDLAHASNREVLSSWSGLGYNKRAIWLRDGAKILANDSSIYGKPSELIKLKGIGNYTSFSIPIFAFNMDYVTVDINIRKIMIFEGFISNEKRDTEFYEIANLLLPKGKSRDWHNALMDYGSSKYSKQKYSLIPENKRPRSFKGSDRYFRGLIIRDLTNQSTLKISYFLDRFQISRIKLIEILNKMETEGLIVIKGNFIEL